MTSDEKMKEALSSIQISIAEMNNSFIEFSKALNKVRQGVSIYANGGILSGMGSYIIMIDKSELLKEKHYKQIYSVIDKNAHKFRDGKLSFEISLRGEEIETAMRMCFNSFNRVGTIVAARDKQDEQMKELLNYFLSSFFSTYQIHLNFLSYQKIKYGGMNSNDITYTIQLEARLDI